MDSLMTVFLSNERFADADEHSCPVRNDVFDWLSPAFAIVKDYSGKVVDPCDVVSLCGDELNILQDALLRRGALLSREQNPVRVFRGIETSPGGAKKELWTEVEIETIKETIQKLLELIQTAEKEHKYLIFDGQ